MDRMWLWVGFDVLVLALALAGVAGAAVGSLGRAYLGCRLDSHHFHWGCQHGCEDSGFGD